ncbi:class I SAM-dependent methyltransferase [Limibaculum sp. FT325]|uniref:class I SAM-dependent methyltransferase n=1 Tax=Thermohalobaculum sediminis TaxID=2939436 RepID=UPI0020BF60B7|nr:methyltransferase domain-containing protein [Limibaculum sediminis]MCL5779290.1 class I SAM-dependent methyltransferase [Limibaculum sediminis]
MGCSPSRTVAFRASLAAYELVSIAKESGRKRLLDIGGGEGIHKRFFESRGLEVDVLDLAPGRCKVEYVGDYEDIDVAGEYDFLWLSHVLEHTRNPGRFIDKLYADVREGGYVCATVPPLRQKMTFAHPVLWNGGSLLINFVRAGFWCGDARVASYGYNTSIIARKDISRSWDHPHEALPDGLEFDGGYFNGDIRWLNWTCRRLPPNDVVGDYEGIPVEKVCDTIDPVDLSTSFFFRAHDARRGKSWTFYYDKALDTAMRCV